MLSVLVPSLNARFTSPFSPLHSAAYIPSMPELAEVEFYRREWRCGLRARIEAVRLHADKRIFRGIAPGLLQKSLPGSRLLESEAHGKQLLFRFSNGGW